MGSGNVTKKTGKQVWEAAWEEECERRIADVRSGEVEEEDFDEAMERLRQKYRLR